MVSASSSTPASPKSSTSLFDSLHLFLFVVVLLTLFGFYYEYVNRAADKEDSRYATLQAATASSDAQNKAAQAQNAQSIAALANQSLVLEGQVSNLAAAIGKRDNALTVQTTAVPKLSPTDLGNQWGAVALEPSPQVDASGAFIVPLPLAQKSVVAIMTVPVLQKDKADLQSEVTAKSSVITNDVSTLADERSAHLSDNATCKADKKLLTEKVDKVTKDARRSKIRSFLFGFGVGAGATVAVVVRYL